MVGCGLEDGYGKDADANADADDEIVRLSFCRFVRST